MHLSEIVKFLKMVNADQRLHFPLDSSANERRIPLEECLFIEFETLSFLLSQQGKRQMSCLKNNFQRTNHTQNEWATFLPTPTIPLSLFP